MNEKNQTMCSQRKKKKEDENQNTSADGNSPPEELYQAEEKWNTTLQTALNILKLL